MRGLEPDIFSSVVSDIYDCALQPDRWSAALARITTLLDAAYIAISLADARQHNAVMAAHSPWDPQMLQILNDEYGADGIPGLREIIFGGVDLANSTMNQMNEEEFQESRFYKNWVKPQGLRDACVVKFAQTPERLGIAAAVTRAGRDVVNAGERRFMSLISPHLRRAALIGDLLDQTRITAKHYREALTQLNTPIILTDATGRILFANANAEKILSEGGSLSGAGGILTCVNHAASTALTDAILRAAKSELMLGDRGIGVALNAPDAAPIIGYVLPLTQGTLRGNMQNAAVALFIAVGGAAIKEPTPALVSLFGLTQSEARVLQHLGGGETLSKIAHAMDLSENTVKTHMSRIYAKTGTSRQAELVNLLNKLSAPAG
jgi:DNA-binding CsgD family transcriptional regulator/PAS domain-containing protein